jgi:DNA polymerase-3 subunit delta'
MLSEIVGQEYAVQILRNSITEQRASGSYLLLGPAHVGKTTAATEFARALLCDNPTEGPDSCGECASCRMVDSNTHPDMRSVRPAGPSHILRIPQIWPRDGIKEFPAHAALLRDLQFGPVRGKHRVFIIEEADSFHEDTANSMLKVLEEPPPYVTFVLTALGQSSVLPTILSRCQQIRFQSVHASEIESLILKRGLTTPEKAHYAASMAQGEVGTALAMAADFHVLAARDAVNEIASNLSENTQLIYALKLAEDLRKSSVKLQVQPSESKGDASESSSSRLSGVAALEMLAFWYRDLIACASGSAPEAIVNSDQLDRLNEIASKRAPGELMRCLETVLAIRDAVERNANVQLAFEAMALRLAALQAQA